MSRKTGSQWEFGELFAAKDLRQVLTVTELTSSVRQLLEERIGTVWVGGEVTNLRVQASGHAYFGLKDESAQLSCVLFRGTPVTGRQLLDDGLKILVQGELTVYEPRGQYQLVVKAVEFQGVGALQLAFEKLKRELDAAGYFAAERKRPLPRFPQRLGLVTSPTGAAIRDVLHAIHRRHPGLQVVLYPCRVQGERAGDEIAAAIHGLNDWSQRQGQGTGLDLILITRGGGSLEDLWAFNERIVAEAIYQSPLPVVSAVGHEIDFTISDFVADLRAATPSAAAEIITEGAHASREFFTDALAAIRRRARKHLRQQLEVAYELSQRLSRNSPLRRLQEQMQYVDDLGARLSRLRRAQWRERQLTALAVIGRLKRTHPWQRLPAMRESLIGARLRMERYYSSRIRCQGLALCGLQDRLRLLSPRNTLARGYSITTDDLGQIIRDAKLVKIGDRIATHVASGGFSSTISLVEPSDDIEK